MYPDTVIGYANKSLHSEVGTKGQVYVVVRSGEQGCFNTPKEISFWCPAYYEDDGGSNESPHVVNLTGAGNNSLNASAIGLLQKVQYIRPPVTKQLELVGAPDFILDKEVVNLRTFDKATMRSIGERGSKTLDR